MAVTLKPVNDENRDAVIALSVREDQPFVAPNDYSLEQAAESNREHPGVAHAYGIYADDRLVGFAMFIFAPEDEYPDDPDNPEEQYGEEDRYYLWRFMIDRRRWRGSSSTSRITARTCCTCPPSLTTSWACTCTTSSASGRLARSKKTRPY